MQNEGVGASPFFIAPGNENSIMQQPGQRGERQGQRAIMLARRPAPTCELSARA